MSDNPNEKRNAADPDAAPAPPFARTAEACAALGLRPPATRIRAVLCDIDGTLVRPDKSLSSNVVAAVAELQRAGIPFSLASSRPPRGLIPFVDALRLSAPLAAYNGGNIVSPQMKVLESHPIRAEFARRALDMLAERHIDAWVFSRGQWQLTRPDGDYVDLEERTIGYGPTIVKAFEDLSAVDKIVGVTADAPLLAKAEEELGKAFAGHLTIGLSQTYYLDITDPSANKGTAALSVAKQLNLPVDQLAVIGDMSNDVPMFRQAGLAIAMGQASATVQAEAHAVTLGNAQDGVAVAIRTLILPRAAVRTRQ